MRSCTVKFSSQRIGYRNENQMQDITTEPIALVIVDFLLCRYGSRDPD
ncbi:DNA/RNA helicase, superfamily I [Pseudomonas amygdali pv. mori]|uniref:DNA/RNA helicase, superfamily I n=1 Tax=Pseudomonas amygdali pv. mori TaxID=34065 RepID=A0A3M5ISV4_PSEA0|nr:hypothetical protein [Pseudomonas amygdali]RMT13893.1 DNA/RNA helicase, superfamily I [Pseudomonas amygdali pv. mori]